MKETRNRVLFATYCAVVGMWCWKTVDHMSGWRTATFVLIARYTGSQERSWCHNVHWFAVR